MKIVFLTPRFYPDVGGVEKHTFEIAKILSKKNNITILTEGGRDKKGNINGIKVIRFFFGKKDWFKKFIIWWKIVANRELIKKADVVHCHDVFFWYLPLRIIFPRKKVFITFHGYETFFPPTFKAIFIRKLSEKLSSGNIAVGRYIEKWYGTKSNKIIYGAVRIRKIKNNHERKNSKLKILFVGRMEIDIGVKIYLEILKKLRNFHFEACGDGSLRTEFEKFGKVHGFVSDLGKYIKRADIVFASSYLSIFEAFSLKKPIVSVYTNPLKRDYLKMTPFSKWIYLGNSPKVLVDKIKSIERKRKMREKNINTSYNWVRNQTWNELANEYLRLWGEK